MRLTKYISKKFLLFIFPVAIFAAVGAYLVFGARAADMEINVTYTDTPLISGINAGQVFSLDNTVTYNNIPSGTKFYTTVRFSVEGGKAESLGYQCGSGSVCTLGTFPPAGDSEFNPVYELCIELPPGASGSNSFTASMQFRALANFPANPLWFSYHGGGETQGNCADSDTPRPPKDPPPEPPPCSPGICNPDDGDSNSGNNNSGPGGGGGSTTANKQGNEPNSLPSSGPQGDSSEPELEPSPFFDGREYAPGSDPIDKALGNVNVGGKRILHGWLYLLGLFIVIGNMIAGYFLWWRRLPFPERMRLKAKLHLGQ